MYYDKRVYDGEQAHITPSRHLDLRDESLDDETVSRGSFDARVRGWTSEASFYPRASIARGRRPRLWQRRRLLNGASAAARRAATTSNAPVVRTVGVMDSCTDAVLG